MIVSVLMLATLVNASAPSDESLRLRLPPAAASILVGSFATPSLSRQGEDVDLGYFGGNYDHVFADSTLAMHYAKTYRNMKTSGFTLALIGIAAGVAGSVMQATMSTNRVPGTAIQLGGAATALTGSILMIVSYKKLEQAVDAYNGQPER